MVVTVVMVTACQTAGHAHRRSAKAIRHQTLRKLMTEGQTFTLPSRKALATTDTELKLIATAAIIGDKSRPNAG